MNTKRGCQSDMVCSTRSRGQIGSLNQWRPNLSRDLVKPEWGGRGRRMEVVLLCLKLVYPSARMQLTMSVQIAFWDGSRDSTLVLFSSPPAPFGVDGWLGSTLAPAAASSSIFQPPARRRRARTAFGSRGIGGASHPSIEGDHRTIPWLIAIEEPSPSHTRKLDETSRPEGRPESVFQQL